MWACNTSLGLQICVASMKCPQLLPVMQHMYQSASLLVYTNSSQVSNRKDNKNAVHFLVEKEKENEIDQHLINKSQKEKDFKLVKRT